MVVEETKNTICSDSQQNILPINLDRDEMRNSSPQYQNLYIILLHARIIF